MFSVLHKIEINSQHISEASKEVISQSHSTLAAH